MNKVTVVYWSGTGNTEAMARAVAEGAQGTLVTAADFTPADLDAAIEEYNRRSRRFGGI